MASAGDDIKGHAKQLPRTIKKESPRKRTDEQQRAKSKGGALLKKRKWDGKPSSFQQRVSGGDAQEVAELSHEGEDPAVRQASVTDVRWRTWGEGVTENPRRERGNQGVARPDNGCRGNRGGAHGGRRGGR